MDQEQQPKNQARETAERIMQEVRAGYEARITEIDNIKDKDEQNKQRTALQQEYINAYRLKARQQIDADKASEGSESQQEKQEKAVNAQHVILEAKALSDVGVNVMDRKSQLFVDKIVENIKSGQITDQGALIIERNIGKDLLDGIVFGKGGQLSDFENNLKTIYDVDFQTATMVFGTLNTNKETFGTPEDLIEKLGINKPENNKPDYQNQKEMSEADMDKQRFAADYTYYQNRFTEEQLKLVSAFYSPEAIVNYLDKMSNGDDNDKSFMTKEKVKHEKEKIKHELEEYYKKNPEDLDGMDRNNKVDEELIKHWGEKVSELFSWKVSDVMNQLFLELQQKSPHKFYEQIMQEDIFTGPAQIKNKIQAAINGLYTRVSQMEHDETGLAKRMRDLRLYRHAVLPHTIEERSKKGPTDKDQNIYPRVKPIPFGEKIGLSAFIEHAYMTIDHIVHKTEFFHNSRAVYGHPPGEKGFYHQLGEFAEMLHGTDIEEILMLPDGQYVLEAYQLYEKMLQEDFAQMDHHHRPDQLTNKLHSVNSEIELEVIKQFMDIYPDLSEQRVKNIINNAVGISRGMTLTEAEMSAYADPTDSEGKGLTASYSTNDAGSLNVFNPMHTIMRWQGEHNFNAMYFMPVHGRPGKMWNSDDAWKNMTKYMKSFYVGTGRKDLPEEVFADSMMNIGKVGGPGKRKGWRTKQSLEGHYVYDDDNTINASKTFQAMEAIGYEAIFNFVDMKKEAYPELLKATEETDPASVKERRELFIYIYKKYFYNGDPKNFQESDFDDYMKKLQVKGEAQVLKVMKGEDEHRITEKGSLSTGSWENQVVYETSQMFLENLLAHYSFARMPTKLLRIDKNRLHKDGIGNWERVWRQFRDRPNNPWKREDFDKSMKDLATAEMLLRRQIGERIREKIKFNPNWTLDRSVEIEDLPYRLNKENIRKLLSENISENENRKNKILKTPEEIDRVIELYEQIAHDFKSRDYLDENGVKEIRKFPFTYGMEDTDISLMAFRNTGPRMAARAIKDVGAIEQHITQWIINMPIILNEIAISGKNDFSPIIKYMKEAQKAITDVNGVADTYEFMYKLAGTAVNYFKKDTMAKPFGGMFRWGKLNSIAAKYSGRSTAAVEWDSRDIDAFAIAMESNGLLKNMPYNLQAKGNDGKFSGGVWEDRWIINPFTKKPMKFNLFGKKRHVDYEYNSLRFRKEFGADGKAMFADFVMQYGPLAIAFLLWKYLKDAMDEAEGKKKQ